MELIPPGALLLAVVATAGGAAALVALTRRSITAAPVPVRAAPPISGLGMTALAGAILSIPITLGAFFPGLDAPLRALLADRVYSTGLTVLIAAALTAFWGALFFRPRAVGAQWRRWNPSVDEVEAVAAARAAFPRAMAEALLLNVAFSSLIFATAQVGVSLPGSAMMLTLIALDALDEWRFRAEHPTARAVFALQRVPEVDALLHRLAEAGIPACARSRHYRAALQFFGPMVPVEVLVPEAHEAEASAVLSG